LSRLSSSSATARGRRTTRTQVNLQTRQPATINLASRAGSRSRARRVS
jgi:hypothetical protein